MQQPSHIPLQSAAAKRHNDLLACKQLLHMRTCVQVHAWHVTQDQSVGIKSVFHPRPPTAINRVHTCKLIITLAPSLRCLPLILRIFSVRFSVRFRRFCRLSRPRLVKPMHFEMVVKSKVTLTSGDEPQS